jgi:hypothetical protein
MQSVWVVGSASEIQQIPFEELQGYFVYGGNVLGNDTNSPLVHEYFNGSSTAKCLPTMPDADLQREGLNGNGGSEEGGRGASAGRNGR